MKYPLRTLSIIVALGLLVAAIAAGPAFFGSQPVEAATVTIAEDDVEFAKADGTDVSSAKPNSTSTIFIRDDALETTKSGTAVFSGIATDSKFFDIASGEAGPASGSASSATVVVTAADYSTSSPASTPLTGNPAATVGSASTFVVGSDADAGTFTILVAASVTTTATFSHHVQDVWTGTDSTLRRAKVISTSDPAGEYVTISEVASATDSTANATSRVFSGIVFLSSDAATQGTNSDGVWVQDADTVTVQYLDSAGTVVDSDTVTIDGVKPTIAAITPADGNVTNVANPTVTFDVTDSGSGISTTNFATDLTLAINGTPVTNISFQAIADGFRAIYASGVAWTTATTTTGGFAVTDSSEFSLTITATDQAGNVQTVETTAANITIDKTAPVLSSAATGSANTAIAVTFSDTVGLDATTIAASDFTISDSVTVSAAAVDADNKNLVNLTVSAMASDLKPTVTVSGISDTAGNSVAAASVVTATDGVKAVQSSLVVDKSLAILADVVTTSIVSDEKLAVDWPIITFNGPSGATSNGALTVTSPTPNNFQGKATIVAGDATGTYGLAIQSKDLGNNLTDNLTDVTAEVVVPVASVLTLANGPLGDTDFSGTVTSADVTVFKNATTTGVPAISAIDASARTITLATTPALSDVWTVTYSYSPDTVEIDQSAPTVTFDPDGSASVQNQSPFVRLIFDEDEYPGDSYKTVTLTAATLTDPDGVATDITSSFSTGDNIEFIWPAADLALGAYTLKVSATDTAGNALTDATGTFTIAKRTVTLAIRPGWNLVSLPDSPAHASSDVNDVFSSDKIDVVLSYDAIRNNWFSATRQSDGTLGRPGSGLALTSVTTGKGYWVHSTAIVSLSVDVPGLAPGSPAQPPSFAMTRGWNLVSYTTSDLTVATIDVDSYFTGLDWSRAFGYDNATNKFTSLLPETSDTVALGKAYWVFLNRAGTLVPP